MSMCSVQGGLPANGISVVEKRNLGDNKVSGHTVLGRAAGPSGDQVSVFVKPSSLGRGTRALCVSPARSLSGQSCRRSIVAWSIITVLTMYSTADLTDTVVAPATGASMMYHLQ